MRRNFPRGFIVRPTPPHDGSYVIYCKGATVGVHPSKKAALSAAWDLSFAAARAAEREAIRRGYNAWKQLLRNADDPYPAALGPCGAPPGP